MQSSGLTNRPGASSPPCRRDRYWRIGARNAVGVHRDDAQPGHLRRRLGGRDEVRRGVPDPPPPRSPDRSTADLVAPLAARRPPAPPNLVSALDQRDVSTPSHRLAVTASPSDDQRAWPAALWRSKCDEFAFPPVELVGHGGPHRAPPQHQNSVSIAPVISLPLLGPQQCGPDGPSPTARSRAPSIRA